MAIQIKGDGTFSIEYEGPYSGLDVQKPETLISDKATPGMSNFMLRNAELRSRPAFILHSPVIVSLAVPQPLNYKSFANTLYYTGNQDLGTAVASRVGLWDGLTANPKITQVQYDASVTNSIAGIALASSPTVGGSLPGGPTIVGPISIGARYIGELNNQLILANVTIVDQARNTVYNFPNLIWWSANGLPLQWDPTQNTSAGFNPFLDVSDQITGLATMGIAGYIFRTYGITQFAPSGSAITPFTFDHMWASDRGIGCVLPWSIAQYGPTAAFVADDNIYSLSITNAQAIGGTARDAIYADIANATDVPVANVIPKLKNGYIYLTYQLVITLATNIRFWIYSFEDKNWSAWDYPLGTDFLSVSAPPNSV